MRAESSVGGERASTALHDLHGAVGRACEATVLPAIETIGRGEPGVGLPVRFEPVNEKGKRMSKAMVAILETKPKVEERPKTKRQPLCNVVLLDDDDHSYAYVISMLQQLFGYEVMRGLKMAREVDTTGRVVVITTTKEHAELKRDQIHAFGRDVTIDRCEGSMSAVIESVEE